MRLAVLYEDKEVFVAYKPEEFVEVLQKLLDKGHSAKEAINIMIVELKKQTKTK